MTNGTRHLSVKCVTAAAVGSERSKFGRLFSACAAMASLGTGLLASPAHALLCNPPPAPPPIAISAPTNGQVFPAGTTSVTVSSNAANPPYTAITYYGDNNSVTIGSGVPPQSFTWSGLTNGSSHNVSAYATGKVNGCSVATWTPTITFTIASCSTVSSPGFSITAPTAGQVFPPGATVTVSSNAGSPYSSVSYYGDFALLGTVGPGTSVTWKPGGGSHSVYATASGTKQGCSIAYTSGSVSFSVDSGPSVSLSAPTSATAPAKIALSASVTSVVSISSVSYYLTNGTLLGTSTTAPSYNVTWGGTTQGNATGVGPGTYSIVAKATDADGAVGTSATSTLTVAAAAPPTASVSVSASRTMLPATLTVNASASDPYTIASLVVTVNGTQCGAAAASSLSCTMSVPLSGGNVGATTPYTIQASASDYWGGAATASTSITETGHPAPTAAITSAEATWLTTGDPEVIAVTASASDVDSVASVALLVNGATVQTLAQPPYNFQAGGYGGGTYSVAVQATNTVGQVTLSAAQNVTVAVAPTVSGDAKNQTRTMKQEFDSNMGRLTKKMTEPEDSNLCLVQTYGHDTFGNVNSITTRNCNGSDANEAAAPTGLAVITTRTTTITFDPTGTYAAKVSNALNQATTETQDPRFGTVLTQYDANKLETQQGTNSPDPFGRVTLLIAPDKTQTKTQYLYCTTVPNNYGTLANCPANAVTAIQVTPLASDGATPIGPWKMTFYDVRGRAIETQTLGFNGSVAIQDTLYDNLGRVHQVSQPYFSGSTPVYTTNTYDVLNRLQTSIDANNDPATNFTYNGLTSSVSDGNGHTTTQTMNGVSQVIGVVDAMDQVMSYQHDPFGNLIETIDGTGVLKSYVYDIRGRKTQTNDPDIGTWKYMYDSLGELVQQTDAKAQVKSLTYDVLGRTTSRTEPTATSTLTSNWEYDIPRSECTTGTGVAVGRLDRAWTGDSNYSRIECYDSLSRPVQERTQIGTKAYVAGLSYDASSRLSSQVYPVGFVYPSGFTINYTYNGQGYLSEIGNTANPAAYWQATGVDAAGNILNESMAGGAFTATRTYDVLNRLKTAQAGAGNTIQNDSFWYDPLGNLSERSWIDNSDVAHSESFGYDPLDRLQTVTGPASKSYSYDAAGDLLTKSDVGTYNYTTGTHMISGIVGTVNGIADPSFGYDSNGNITSEAGLTATWTSFNMPSTLTRGTFSRAFLYGPEHQRVETVNSGPGDTVSLYYVGSSFEQNVDSSTGITENHNYIAAYGRRIAVAVDDSNGASSWRYYQQDRLGSIEVGSDQTGTVVERMSYDAWGKRRNLDGTDSASLPATLDHRGYTDQEELDTIDLVNMNARIYDPVIARFISPDPIIQSTYNPRTHNRYAYALNAPLGLIDPSGYTTRIPVVGGAGDPLIGMGPMIFSISVDSFEQSEYLSQIAGQLNALPVSTGCTTVSSCFGLLQAAAQNMPSDAPGNQGSTTSPDTGAPPSTATTLLGVASAGAQTPNSGDPAATLPADQAVTVTGSQPSVVGALDLVAQINAFAGIGAGLTENLGRNWTFEGLFKAGTVSEIAHIAGNASSVAGVVIDMGSYLSGNPDMTLNHLLRNTDVALAAAVEGGPLGLYEGAVYFLALDNPRFSKLFNNSDDLTIYMAADMFPFQLFLHQ